MYRTMGMIPFNSKSPGTLQPLFSPRLRKTWLVDGLKPMSTLSIYLIGFPPRNMSLKPRSSVGYFDMQIIAFTLHGDF